MAWVRIDDAFYDHHKFQQVNALGVAIWVAGLAWSNRNLSDGFIPERTAHRLVDLHGIDVGNGMTGRPATATDGINQLLEADIWREVDGGFQITNYLEFQPSADEVKARREGNALRQAQFRRRKVEETDSNAGSNGVTNQVVTHAPNPKPKKIKTIAQPDGRANDFDRFWAIYPRRVGKAKAAKAWQTAIRTTSPDLIVEGAQRLAADPNLPQAKFIPHPTTWLTRAGWEDDPYPGDNAPAVRLVRDRCPEHTHHEQPCATCAAEVAAGLRREPA
jgi:hypothetical protein